MRRCEQAVGSTSVAGLLSLGTVTLGTGHPLLQGPSCALQDASLVPHLPGASSAPSPSYDNQTRPQTLPNVPRRHSHPG